MIQPIQITTMIPRQVMDSLIYMAKYTPTSMSNLTLQAGVENLLDKDYTDHLNGFNRVEGNGVDLGERLPGSGINAFVTVGISF